MSEKKVKVISLILEIKYPSNAKQIKLWNPYVRDFQIKYLKK